MRNLFRKVATLVGAAALSASASAFDNMYIFGDSLSDTGNIALIVPGAPQRFTNGNTVAIDVLTAHYGLQAIPSLAGGNNYAFGGAIAIGSETQFDTNLPIQVNGYLAANGFVADPAALYVVIIGGNDLFAARSIRAASVPEASGSARQDIRKAAEARVTAAIDSIEAQLLKLVAAGAQNILVGNAPDVSQVPGTDKVVNGLLAAADDKHETKRANKFYKYTSKLASQYNSELAAAVARVEVAANIDIIEWDLASFLSDTIEDADELGYTNSEDACLDNLANLPACTGYIFFDDVHPTTVAHTAAGQAVVDLLNP